ncbi:GNAT family N-acetyltransferase [Zooshikella sp. RANM57]|uniref:GNAT family N-acetyltransferase n=1 Tax=Zooshikella sp. RANM57 TaxID=3425863 RepID=UPI003D6E8EB0
MSNYRTSTQCQPSNAHSQPATELPIASLWQTSSHAQQQETLLPMPLCPVPASTAIPGAEYHSFHQSPIWAMQRAYFQQMGINAWRQGDVPHYITSTPLLADHYATIIVNYLKEGLTNDLINCREPIYLLELGAGCGRFSYLLLKKLAKKWNEVGVYTTDRQLIDINDIPLVLLISDFVENNRAFLANHPYLTPYIKKGLAQVIPYDAAKGDDQLVPWLANTTNPLITIANYFYDSLPQALVYYHYGQWYSGEVALIDKRDQPENNTHEDNPEGKGPFAQQVPHYRWQPIDHLEQWCTTLAAQTALTAETINGLLHYYQTRLMSNPLLIPVGALSVMAQLRRLTQDNLLVLSADQGGYDRDWLTHMPIPSLTAHGSFSLPVNFDVITRFFSSEKPSSDHRIWCCQQKHRLGGLVLQAILVNPGDYECTRTYNTIEKIVKGFNGDDFFVIKRALHDQLEQLTPDQMLSYCRLSQFDYKVLALFLPRLLEQGVPISQRLTWCEVLTRCWENFFPLGKEQHNFAFNLGLFAVDLSHWRLAKQLFKHCIVWEGESLALHHNLGLCYYSTGYTTQAVDCLQQALALDPDDAQTQQLYGEVTRWQQHCAQLTWYFPSQAQQGDLRLEPLGIQHGSEFLLQYRNPSIAALTRLYTLDSFAAVQQFIHKQQQNPQRALFAVLHQDYGLVGVVSYEWSASVGYFYFWTGTDYQQQGFGRQAAELACRQAQALGLTQLFTTTWHFNNPSIKTLTLVGFESMGCVSHNQGYLEYFYQKRLIENENITHDPTPDIEILKRLLAAMGSNMTLEVNKTISSEGLGNTINDTD